MNDSDLVFLFCLFLLNPFFIFFLIFTYASFHNPYDGGNDVMSAFFFLFFAVGTAFLLSWIYNTVYSLNPDAFMFINPKIKWKLITQLIIFWLSVQAVFWSGLFLFFFALPDLFFRGDAWSFTGKLTLVFIPSACATLYFAFTYPYGF